MGLREAARGVLMRPFVSAWERLTVPEYPLQRIPSDLLPLIPKAPASEIFELFELIDARFQAEGQSPLSYREQDDICQWNWASNPRHI